MTKFSELPTISTIGDADIFSGDQGGTTVQFTAAQIASYVDGKLKVAKYGHTTFDGASGGYTAVAGDAYVAQTGTMSTGRTVTLPSAAAVPAGWPLTIADESGTVNGGRPITIARAGTDTINGSPTSIAIGNPYGARTLRSDGVSKWTVMATYGTGSIMRDVGAATVTNTVVGPTSLLAAAFTLPANYLAAGERLTVAQVGTAVINLAAGTIRWLVTLGGITILDFTSNNTIGVSANNHGYALSIELFVNAIGASGVSQVDITPRVFLATNSASGPGVALGAATGGQAANGGRVTTFDTTATMALAVTATFSSTGATLSVTPGATDITHTPKRG